MSGKLKEKVKDCSLVHAPSMYCMLVTQQMVSIQIMILLSRLTNLYTQCSHQFIASNNDNDIKMVDAPPMQEESGPSTHAIKCGMCKKNNQPCIGIPRWTCNECMKAKT